jgi:hypothetical protein
MLKQIHRTCALASLSVLLATTGAQAAGLGGDCCADLEERIAELEATTARKAMQYRSPSPVMLRRRSPTGMTRRSTYLRSGADAGVASSLRTAQIMRLDRRLFDAHSKSRR